MLKKVIASLENSEIRKMGDYDYVITPLLDGIPSFDPILLREIVNVIKRKIDLSNIDKILCIESMGIPFATALSLDTEIPFEIIRKRKYDLPGEVQVNQETGYSKGNLYINYLKKGEKVIIIEDVVSTGGTLIATINTLKNMGIEISNVIAIVEKYGGKKTVEKETGVPLLTMVKLNITNGKIMVKSLV
ncbi:MAG: adenine phosphoribosyltransferase [Methanobrevibacter sp.]|jgi:adenine phosphoribosyltransferase|nr:adenine phosphoribosyltransferase [Methanobrevibacter sp.]